MERILIVDGHSMIFAWNDIRAIHSERNERGRDELVHRLATYQDATDARVVVVFDGKGAKNESRLDDSGIQVIYSKSGLTADTVIERLVATYSGQHSITVATNDRMERQTVLSFGGEWIDSDKLLAELESSAANLRERIRRHNSRPPR